MDIWRFATLSMLIWAPTEDMTWSWAYSDLPSHWTIFIHNMSPHGSKAEAVLWGGEGSHIRTPLFFFSTFRTIFNWAVKSDPGLLWFHFTMLCDWSRKPARLSEQLKFKTWSVVFSSISSRFPALYFEFKLVHDANLSKFKTWSAVFSSTSSRFLALYFELKLVHDANLCSNWWFWLLSFWFFDTQ